MTLVHRLEQQHREMSHQMDALYIDPDTVDMRTWLERRELAEFTQLFEQHKIDFEVRPPLHPSRQPTRYASFYSCI